MRQPLDLLRGALHRSIGAIVYTHNALLRNEVPLDFVMAVANNPECALDNIGITVSQIGSDTFPHTHRYLTEAQSDDFLNSIT